MNGQYQHLPVLTQALIAYLKPQAGDNFIDCTLGGGGHSHALLAATAPTGKVLAFELDARAIAAAQAKLKVFEKRVIIVHDSYAHLQAEYLQHKKALAKVAGIILDLGLSSDQLESAQRGFSFRDTGPLDMRFDPTAPIPTASDIILTATEATLEKIFREYGEEVQAKRLAKGIVLWRDNLVKQKQKIVETSMLVSAILRILNIKESDLKKFRRHPATLVFQALRIAVNQEFVNLQAVLPQAIDILAPGGQLAVISFHSLEDRIVKRFFQSLSKGCICPPDLPICVCGNKPKVELVTKKAIKPSAAEVAANPRSRSAVLRIVRKI